MTGIFRFFRSVIFLGWLSFALATAAIAATVWGVQMATTAAALTAKAASTAAAHRKQIAKAVATTKAKARLRRVLVAVPVAGLGAAAFFEEQDYQAWLEENPEGDREQYLCEQASLTAEIADEMLQEMPEKIRPSKDWLNGKIGTCSDDLTSDAPR